MDGAATNKTRQWTTRHLTKANPPTKWKATASHDRTHPTTNIHIHHEHVVGVGKVQPRSRRVQRHQHDGAVRTRLELVNRLGPVLHPHAPVDTGVAETILLKGYLNEVQHARPLGVD